MPIEVVIVSHRRAGKVTTHKVVPDARVCVPASQADAYAQHHERGTLLVHPDSVVGLCAKRQWVYETVGDVMMLDDDAIGLFRIYRPARSHGRRELCSPRRAWELIQLAGETARKLGAFLFGFASHAHPLTYREHRPFRFGGYTPGGAMGLLAGSKLWWPTDCTLPIDDYWICLLNAYHHRFAWYDGRFAFGFRDTYTGAGGMAEFRVGDTEREATAYLLRWFGQAIRPKQLRGQATKRNRNRWARQIDLPYGI